MEGGEEFKEEEVWSVLRDKETPSHETKMSKSNNLFSASSSSSARYIPKGNEVSGAKQSSAPMNVPDWSKIYGNTLTNNTRSSHLHSWAIHDDDEDDEMVPPHELVAKRLARTQISSFSMCEGIGRTLKGRDLSKTRNAVLTKTGFLESNITSTSPP